jgi:hypothetical protein
MRAPSFAFAAVLPGVLLLASVEREAPAGRASPEVVRVRAHLARVEAQLMSADVSALTAAQRAARARHIAVLRQYRDAGVFPHNHIVAERRVPVFVDEHDSHCAVGYLLARDGRHDIVERVRRTRNTATVPELADDPALVAWLTDAGLTLAEAAQIQPTYGPAPGEEESDTYNNVSLVAIGLSGGASIWNLIVLGKPSSRRLPGGIGTVLGIVDIGLAFGGIIATTRENDPNYSIDDVMPTINLGAGVVTATIGLINLLRRAPVALPAQGSNPSRQAAHWHVTPWSPAGSGNAGVRLEVRF